MRRVSNHEAPGGAASSFETRARNARALLRTRRNRHSACQMVQFVRTPLYYRTSQRLESSSTLLLRLIQLAAAK
jgi:hypothetical protein